jgi:hypothetical protein
MAYTSGILDRLSPTKFKDSARKQEDDDDYDLLGDPISVIDRNDLPTINKRLINMSLDISKVKSRMDNAGHTDGTDRTDREILEE